MGRALKGVTLTEILFALAIVAIAIISLVTLFVSGLKLVNRSAELERSAEVARQVLEGVVDHPDRVPPGASTFDGRLNDPRDVTTGFPPGPYPAASVDGRNYPILVTVEPVGNLRVVQVRVFYDADQSVWIERSLFP